MSDTPRTVEQRLEKWQAQSPVCRVSPAEWQFIAYMRASREQGVGFGWMQQVIEWEWQATGLGSHGPEYFTRELQAAQDKLAAAEKCSAFIDLLEVYMVDGQPRFAVNGYPAGPEFYGSARGAIYAAIAQEKRE